jgi:hypothetical protein
VAVRYGRARGRADPDRAGRRRRHCADLGRPYEEISETVSTRLAAGESARAFADRCAVFAELGLDHAIVITDGPWTADPLQTLADAVALG